jgi:hypothetical protein
VEGCRSTSPKELFRSGTGVQSSAVFRTRGGTGLVL